MFFLINKLWWSLCVNPRFSSKHMAISYSTSFFCQVSTCVYQLKTKSLIFCVTVARVDSIWDGFIAVAQGHALSLKQSDGQFHKQLLYWTSIDVLNAISCSLFNFLWIVKDLIALFCFLWAPIVMLCYNLTIYSKASFFHNNRIRIERLYASCSFYTSTIVFSCTLYKFNTIQKSVGSIFPRHNTRDIGHNFWAVPHKSWSIIFFYWSGLWFH